MTSEKIQPTLSLRRGYALAEIAGPILPVSVSFLRLEIARGKLAATRLGRRVIVTAEELDRYIAQAGA
jgi:excisionase family DNA binding protein